MGYFGYVYIIDYNSSKIYEVELNENTNDLDAEELLDRYGLNFDECYTIYSYGKIKIESLTK